MKKNQSSLPPEGKREDTMDRIFIYASSNKKYQTWVGNNLNGFQLQKKENFTTPPAQYSRIFYPKRLFIKSKDSL